MELNDSALPLHEDATAKIRPRIFLEGNFFVDLKPGTPGAPELDSGDTIKITQTATPVQLDQVLTSLQSDSREDLQALLDGLNTALNSKPTAGGGRATPTRCAQGQTARRVLQRRARRHPRRRALDRAGARGAARHRAGPRRRAADPRHGEHRRRAQPLREPAQGPDHQPQPDDGGVRVRVDEPARLDPRAARRRCATPTAAFDSLNAAFPSTRAFATEIRPGVRETPATIEAAFPWIEQTRALVGRTELGGLAEELSPATADLARLIDRATELLPQTDLAVQVPARRRAAGRRPRDPATSSRPARRTTRSSSTRWSGIAGEGQNFDGNGMYVRFQTGGGSQTVSLGPTTHEHRRAVRQQHRGAARQPARLPGQAAAVQARRALLHSRRSPDVNGPAGGEVRADRRAAAHRAGQVRARQARASEADLQAVRKKLNPFGAKRRPLPEKAK